MKVHVGDVIDWSGEPDDQFFVVHTYSVLARSERSKYATSLRDYWF